MTREEFESILEEAFLEGYNNAYEEIEEILDEDYIDIEDDYEVYDEDAHKRNIGRHLGYAPGSDPGSDRAFKEKNHAIRKAMQFLKRDYKNNKIRDDEGRLVLNKNKINTDNKLKKFNKSRKFLLDKMNKYNEKVGRQGINVSKFIRTILRHDSPNVKARINANNYNNIYDRAILKHKRLEGHREIPREDD